MEMLAQRGALAVDADELVHQLLETDAAVQAEVVARFGSDVQAGDGAIDRAKLGDIVFRDGAALRDLEAILHPRVGARVNELISRGDAPVVVVEAVKLLESELRLLCQAIWVTICSEEQQLRRLMNGRGLTRDEAMARIRSQPPQFEKAEQADVVIDTSGPLDQTEQQVEQAWLRELESARDQASRDTVTDEIVIRRASLRDAGKMVAFINRARPAGPRMDRTELVESFGEQGYMVAEVGGELRAVVGWFTEDLIARIRQVIIFPASLGTTVGKALLEEVCRAASELMGEVALLFPPLGASGRARRLYRECGFEEASLEEMIPAWRKAAQQSMPEESFVMVRELRARRVMRPL
jgi:dephospho-CoA kinase